MHSCEEGTADGRRILSTSASAKQNRFPATVATALLDRLRRKGKVNDGSGAKAKRGASSVTPGRQGQAPGQCGKCYHRSANAFLVISFLAILARRDRSRGHQATPQIRELQNPNPMSIGGQSADDAAAFPSTRIARL